MIVGLQYSPGREKFFDKVLQKGKFIAMDAQDCFSGRQSLLHLPLHAKDKTQDYEGYGYKDTKHPFQCVKLAIHLCTEVIHALIQALVKRIYALIQALVKRIYALLQVFLTFFHP